MTEVNNIVYKFYPRNISCYTVEYEGTKEYTLLQSIKTRNDERWEKFMDDCAAFFGKDNIEDKSNGEVSNILVIAISFQRKKYIVSMYLSKLIKRYCFLVTKLESQLQPFPDFNSEQKRYWNVAPIEIEEEIITLNKLIKKNTRTIFY